jgi:hypothetical protein
MVALLFFVLRLLVSPLRPISRLEAENAALRTREQWLAARLKLLDAEKALTRKIHGELLKLGIAVAQSTASELSPLLALEISEPGRPATNRCGSARIDPADEH